MPHVETTALAIAMDFADMAANHPVPKVAETHPQQWETANATAVVIYASVVQAIAKEPAKEVAVLVLQEDSFISVGSVASFTLPNLDKLK